MKSSYDDEWMDRWIPRIRKLAWSMVAISLIGLTVMLIISIIVVGLCLTSGCSS